MKIYRGLKGFRIEVEDNGIKYKLEPHNRLASAFCWGRGGICASETAYSLLADCCGRKAAELYHTNFKWDVVANLKPRWRLSDESIKAYVSRMRRRVKFNLLREDA